MNNLIDLEKKINSELTTKINKTSIKHNQIYVEIDKEDLIDVVLFIKTNKDIKFRQLIDITVVDYPEETQRFKIVYLFLSHEFNHRLILSYTINENELISSLNWGHQASLFARNCLIKHIAVIIRAYRGLSKTTPTVFKSDFHPCKNSSK